MSILSDNAGKLISLLRAVTEARVYDPATGEWAGGGGLNPNEKYLAVGINTLGDGIAVMPPFGGSQAACLLGDHAKAGIGLVGEGIYEDPETAGLPEKLVHHPSAVAISPDRLKCFWFGEGAKAIGRANVEGALEVEEEWVKLAGTSTAQNNGLACNSTHLYWINDEFIARVKLDGTVLEEEWLRPQHELIEPREIAVDETHVYFAWLDHTTEPAVGKIGRMKIDGTGLEKDWIVVGPGAAFSGLAVSAIHVYWSQTGMRPFGIGRAHIDGTDIQLDWLFLQFEPGALAVGPNTGEEKGEHVWWINTFGVGHVWLPTKDA